jgi:hypothetical protein
MAAPVAGEAGAMTWAAKVLKRWEGCPDDTGLTVENAVVMLDGTFMAPDISRNNNEIIILTDTDLP